MARELPVGPEMARIAVKVVCEGQTRERYCLSITGRLSRRDLRRLERACGRAMEHRTPHLEIRVATQAELDAPALFFLERLRARRAIILGVPRPNTDAPASR